MSEWGSLIFLNCLKPQVTLPGVNHRHFTGMKNTFPFQFPELPIRNQSVQICLLRDWKSWSELGSAKCHSMETTCFLALRATTLWSHLWSLSSRGSLFRPFVECNQDARTCHAEVAGLAMAVGESWVSGTWDMCALMGMSVHVRVRACVPVHAHVYMFPSACVICMSVDEDGTVGLGTEPTEAGFTRTHPNWVPHCEPALGKWSYTWEMAFKWFFYFFLK